MIFGPGRNQTGWNLLISQFIRVNILLLKMVVGWNPVFLRHRFHILHFPNSIGLFTKPTGRYYTRYWFSPDIVPTCIVQIQNAREMEQKIVITFWSPHHIILPIGEKTSPSSLKKTQLNKIMVASSHFQTYVLVVPIISTHQTLHKIKSTL
jgi:hypothetical protein